MSISISILVNKDQEVLLRVIGVMIRRALYIESLQYEQQGNDTNKIVISASGNEERLVRIVFQLQKIVGVLSVERL